MPVLWHRCHPAVPKRALGSSVLCCDAAAEFWCVEWCGAVSSVMQGYLAKKQLGSSRPYPLPFHTSLSIFVLFICVRSRSRSSLQLLTLFWLRAGPFRLNMYLLHPFTALLSTVGTVIFRRVKTISSSDPVVVNKQTTIRRSFLRHLGFLWRAHLKLQDIG